MKTIFHFHDQVYCGAELTISAIDTTSEKNIKIELREEGGGGSDPRWNQVFVSQEVLARIAAAASDFLTTAIPRASSVCPICTKDTPHAHSPEEVVAHRNELKRRAPQAASQQAETPTAWIAWYDGVKSQNVARTLAEKAEIENIARLMGYDATLTWEELYSRAPQAATTASASVDCSTCNGNREREVSEFKTVPCPDCAQAPSQPASASGEKPFAGPGAWFSVDVLGNPMRQYAPGKWENCEWPSSRAPTPSQSAPQIKTWQERTGNHSIRPGSVKHMIAEIADLRAALARAPLPAQQVQAEDQPDHTQPKDPK